MAPFSNLLSRLFPSRTDPAGGRTEDDGGPGWSTAGGLEVALFAGELVEAPAEAICTSTNPRLSLGGGTGRAVLEETGWGLKRQLEAIAEAEARRTGDEELPVGFTCATPGGLPPHRLIVHCVASGRAHRSSPEAARRCTEGALREADRAGCGTLALPVFGTGHAGLPYDRAVQAMAEALRAARPKTVRKVYLVVFPAHRAPLARQILDKVLAATPRPPLATLENRDRR